jgi:hypothetical protein
MSAAENKKLLESIFSELSVGNSRPFVEAMADDFSWTVTGTTKWSKKYAGKSVVLGELFGTLTSRMDGRIKTIRIVSSPKATWWSWRHTAAIRPNQASPTTTVTALFSASARAS